MGCLRTDRILLQVPHTEDFAFIWFGGSGGNSKGELFRHNLLDYPSNTTQKKDFRNEYLDMKSQYYSYYGEATYDYVPGHGWKFNFGYKGSVQYSSYDRSLFRLDMLEE